LRKDAGLTGRALAALVGWDSPRISKIEYGKQMPTEDDIRAWCHRCQATDQISDLITTVRNIDAMYTEWRRVLRAGTHGRRQASLSLEAQTGLFHWYEPVLVPGILHTVEYATAVIAFYQTPDDLADGVAARMQRRHVLYEGNHRFHFILARQALLTTVGDTQVMLSQLDRLLTVISLPRIRLGIIPATVAYRVPTNQFIMFDERLVHVETISVLLALGSGSRVLFGLVSRAHRALRLRAGALPHRGGRRKTGAG